MNIKMDILKFWNVKKLCSLAFTFKKETKQILAEIPESSFLFSKKIYENLAAGISFHFHPAP